MFRILWRLFFAALCFVFAFAALVYFYPREVLTIDSGEVKGDALVVLGGGDGRAERAAVLFRQGAAPRVVVTGYGDCASNIQVLEKNGVPSSVITAEPKALNTLENAELALPILRKQNAHRIIIVTSWFHSRRSRACFQHFAPDLIFFSRPAYIDYAPEHRNRTTYSEHVNGEYVKTLGYWLRYGVGPL